MRIVLIPKYISNIDAVRRKPNDNSKIRVAKRKLN